MKRMLLLLILIFLINVAYSQNKYSLNKYKMCNWDKTLKDIVNCQEEAGQLVFKTITINPNKSISLEFKEGSKFGSSPIFQLWYSNKLSTNNDKDLFIYDFLNTDLNKNTGTQISIIMNWDFSINTIVYVVNINGNILHFQMYQ